jgi:cytochrome bd-type quinol oxidase subunit 2
MSKTDTNILIVLTSAYLVVAAIRDLYDKNRGTGHTSTWFTAVFNFLVAFLLMTFARTEKSNLGNNMNGSNNMLLRSLVVALFVAMFMAGVFMVIEGTGNNPESEPNKKWMGMSYILAASLIGAGYVFFLAPSRNNLL